MQKALTQKAPEPSTDWRTTLRLGYLTLIVAFGGFLAWSMTARLDGAAVAAGVVAVESNRKTVQHLEGGIVREILVREGDRVQKGQVLLRLDPTRVEAVGDLQRNQLAILLAQEARLLAEREWAETVTFPAEAIERSTAPIVARAISDQRQQFEVRRGTLKRTLEVADAQIAQAQREIEQARNEGQTARDTLKNISRELDSLMPLYEKKLVPMTRITTLQREKLRLEGQISNSEISITKLTERVQELTLRREQARQDYRQEASASLAELQKSLNEIRQNVIVAEDTQRRSEVLSPTEGVVQQMRIFTVGGVVGAGDPILDVAPTSEDLVVRAKVSPLDIDRVYPGMKAEIRFPSLRSFGAKITMGKLRSVSRDRLLDEVTRDPYFAAEVEVHRDSVPPEFAEKLSAGMPANVVIPTGERTALNYLLTPVFERYHSAMRER
ncbi:HlyD family type I secretion periplasmic adaptor subunit [Microvirga massiliensis]|uniref:HlyD family type I secretion periplasmic adaptor subunit n=1 Tax=Microvirga massiliensis TaxID=1033741 RepID=UPI00062B52BB|nr:HlyD family type I secretion periplasmic adaptor subunit [Microvirga massiliensis]